MLAFGDIESASRLCTGFAEVRAYFPLDNAPPLLALRELFMLRCWELFGSLSET